MIGRVCGWARWAKSNQYQCNVSLSKMHILFQITSLYPGGNWELFGGYHTGAVIVDCHIGVMLAVDQMHT